MRPGHFHGGIDIKTDGGEGKPLVAVADGYVSRVSVSPSGYGRAIYLTLGNGTTAVYGHLQRFRGDIEKTRPRRTLPPPREQRRSLVRPRRMARRTRRHDRIFGQQRFVAGSPSAFRTARHPDPAALQRRARRRRPPRRRPAAPHHAHPLHRGGQRAGRSRPRQAGELLRRPRSGRPLPADARRACRHGTQRLFRPRSQRPPQRGAQHLRSMEGEHVRGRRSRFEYRMDGFTHDLSRCLRRREPLPHAAPPRATR